MSPFVKRVRHKLYLRHMQRLDMNLLISLDVLLKEQSVTVAAEKMNLSVAAMSRALLRVRKMMGDPILVRAGRHLVPTPKALELQPRIRALAEEAFALIRSAPTTSLADLERTFTIRTEESYIGALAPRIAEMLHKQAPKIVLRFLRRPEEDIEALREGLADLDIGPIRMKGPELKVQMLFRGELVGVVRGGHPLSKGRITAKKFVEYRHISVSRNGKAYGPIDRELEKLGLRRTVVLSVPTFYAALVAAATSEMVAAIPRTLSETAVSLFGVHLFDLPVPVESVRISQAWHPRLDADPAHKLLRECVRAAYQQK
jgi:DNA-binding transcriptional LysR family regulator